MFMGSSHTRTCDKRSPPHTPSLQHHTAWLETRGGVQHSGHKVQETISGRGESIPHSSVSRATKQANSSTTPREKAHCGAGSSSPQQPAATTESSERSGWAGFLLRGLQDHSSCSCRITRPVQAAPAHSPNSDLIIAPQHHPQRSSSPGGLWQGINIQLLSNRHQSKLGTNGEQLGT